jgi:N12 class adenine-specific DNA methylase/predicted kinase/GGDEF domain-containing protein
VSVDSLTKDLEEITGASWDEMQRVVNGAAKPETDQANPTNPKPQQPQTLDPYIDEASRTYGIDRSLLEAVIDSESAGKVDAVPIDPKTGKLLSSAYGPMQLLKGTAAELGVDRKDPRQNILGGAKYLRQLIDEFGNERTALAAYFKGPGRLRKEGAEIMDKVGGTTAPHYADTILAKKAKRQAALVSDLESITGASWDEMQRVVAGGAVEPGKTESPTSLTGGTGLTAEKPDVRPVDATSGATRSFDPVPVEPKVPWPTRVVEGGLKATEQALATGARMLAAGQMKYAQDTSGPKILQPSPKVRAQYEKNAKFLLAGAEELDPFADRKRKLAKQIDNIAEMKPGVVKSWKMGGTLDMGVSQLAFDAAMSDNLESVAQVKELRTRAREVSNQDESQKPAGVVGLARDVSRMLNPMVTTGAKGAVPVIGAAWSVSDWARQGAGDVYMDLLDAGVTHETAKSIMPAAGLIYAAVERVQFGQVTNLGGKATKVLKDKVKSAIVRLVIEKGLDFSKEVTEEAVQRFVTDAAVELGKTAEGKSFHTIPSFIIQEGKNMVEEGKAAAPAMGVLSLFGLGGGMARQAVASKLNKNAGPAGTPPAVAAPSPAPAPVGSAPIQGGATDQKDQTNQTGTGTAQPAPAPATERTLSSYGVTSPAAFYAQPEARRDEIFAGLSESEKMRVMSALQEEQALEMAPVAAKQEGQTNQADQTNLTGKEATQLAPAPVAAAAAGPATPATPAPPDVKNLAYMGDSMPAVRTVEGKDTPVPGWTFQVDMEDGSRGSSFTVPQGATPAEIEAERDRVIAQAPPIPAGGQTSRTGGTGRTEEITAETGPRATYEDGLAFPIQNVDPRLTAEDLDPVISMRKPFAGETDPARRAAILEAESEKTDPVVPGMFKTSAAWRLINKMRSKKIPFSFALGDGRELKAWNTHHNNVHSLTDQQIREVWGEYSRVVRANGGLVARESGDEFTFVFPGKTSLEAEKILSQADQAAAPIIQRLGISELPSAKKEYNSLPLGSGFIDWGVVDGLAMKNGDMTRVADDRMEERKKAAAIDKASKIGYIPNRDSTGKLVGFERRKQGKKVSRAPARNNDLRPPQPGPAEQRPGDAKDGGGERGANAQDDSGRGAGVSPGPAGQPVVAPAKQESQTSPTGGTGLTNAPKPTSSGKLATIQYDNLRKKYKPIAVSSTGWATFETDKNIALVDPESLNYVFFSKADNPKARDDAKAYAAANPVQAPAKQENPTKQTDQTNRTEDKTPEPPPPPADEKPATPAPTPEPSARDRALARFREKQAGRGEAEEKMITERKTRDEKLAKAKAAIAALGESFLKVDTTRLNMAGTRQAELAFEAVSSLIEAGFHEFKALSVQIAEMGREFLHLPGFWYAIEDAYDSYQETSTTVEKRPDSFMRTARPWADKAISLERRYEIAKPYALSLPETYHIATDERITLRKDVEKKLYGDGAAKKERVFTYIIGLPASGKSTVANKLVEETGSLLVDCDEAKKLLPEYDGGIGANAVHEESSLLTKNILARALESGDNIVYPTLGSKMASINKLLDLAVKHGYSTKIIYVKIDPAVAIERLKARFEKKGRYVDTSHVTTNSVQIGDNYGILKIEREDAEYEERDGQTGAVLARSLSRQDAGGDTGSPGGAGVGDSDRGVRGSVGTSEEEPVTPASITEAPNVTTRESTSAPERVPAEDVSGAPDEREAGVVSDEGGGGLRPGVRPANVGGRSPRSRGARNTPAPAHLPAAGERTAEPRGDEPRAPGTLRNGGRTDDASDYHITSEDNVGKGGAKAKYADNVAAIRTLHKIESENRKATPEEQSILVKYVGWGGLANALDANHHDKWQKEFDELKDLLTAEEYDEAKRSTFAAHFTSPDVILATWNAVRQLGFHGGPMLEPSCGIGHFLGLRPFSKNMPMFGVELDSLSARIAQQLYQSAYIQHKGFEEVDVPADYYNLVMSNFPFSDDVKPYDKNAKKYGIDKPLSLHNFFFVKSLYTVKPGGLLVAITSRYTMDNRSPAVRAKIAAKADFLGAIRLPDTSFVENARTEVVTDVIFLQKRAPGQPMSDLTKQFLGTGTVNLPKAKDDGGPATMDVAVNKYYLQHPEMILGEQSLHGTMYAANGYTVTAPASDIPALYAKAAENLPRDVMQVGALEESATASAMAATLAPDYVPIDGYFLDDKGEIRQKLTEGKSIPIGIDRKKPGYERKIERVKGMMAIRDAAKALLKVQTESDSDAPFEAARKKVNKLYDKFVTDFGYINSVVNKSLIHEDPDASLLWALEKWDRVTKTGSKTDIMQKRTATKYTPVTTAASSPDALLVTLAQKGTLDFAHMSSLTGKPTSEIERDLVAAGSIFELPDVYLRGLGETQFVLSDDYLSGNVREKLRLAQEAVKSDPRFQRNVDSLTPIIPADLDQSQITVRMNCPILRVSDVQAFVDHLLGDASQGAKVDHERATSKWTVLAPQYDENVQNIQKWGIPELHATRIVALLLNSKQVQVLVPYQDEKGDTKYSVDEEKTAKAAEKAEMVLDEFNRWLWRDADRTQYIIRTYNDAFNSDVTREYVHPSKIAHPDTPVTFPHLAFAGTIRAHVADAVWRITQSKNTMLAHVVGAGKTLEMTISAMELKRMGLRNKSMIVVPNHMVEQWATEVRAAYPAARLLVATGKNFDPKHRRTFINRIATGNWDIVIIRQSHFEMIPLSPEIQEAHYNQEMGRYIDALMARDKEDNGRGDKNDRHVKDLEARIESYRAKIAKLQDAHRDVGVATFNQLGVDQLYVDEADEFKNLDYYSQLENVAGMGSKDGAEKTTDMMMKVRHIQKLGGGIVFATGTPISNSMAETYHMMRYLQPDILKELKIEQFDEWKNVFGQEIVSLELDNSGKGYKQRTRFSQFVNVPELMTQLRKAWDIKTADMLERANILVPGKNIPKANYQNLSAPATPAIKSYINHLAKREKILSERKGPPQKGEDNVLVIIGDGRKAAVDMRLINSSLPDDPDSKLNLCIRLAADLYKKHAKQRLTGIIFYDLTKPDPNARFNVHYEIRRKLVAAGVKDEEIAFIHDYNTDARKLELYDAVNSGTIRIVVGSTKKLGAGTNIQRKLKWEIHLDAPWRPRDIEQRVGRIVRQGNENIDGVDIYRLVTKGSYDVALWNLLDTKAKTIAQVMAGNDSTTREIDDDAAFASVKLLAIDNPLIKESMELGQDVKRLEILQRGFSSEQSKAMVEVSRLPAQIKDEEDRVAAIEDEIKRRGPKGPKFVGITIKGKKYDDRVEAGTALVKAVKERADEYKKKMAMLHGRPDETPEPVGEIGGIPFKIRNRISGDGLGGTLFINEIMLKGRRTTYYVEVSESPIGAVSSVEHELYKMEDHLTTSKSRVTKLKANLATNESLSQGTFTKAEELSNKKSRYAVVMAELAKITKATDDSAPTEDDGYNWFALEAERKNDPTQRVEAETVKPPENPRESFYSWSHSGEWELQRKAIATRPLAGLEDRQFFAYKGKKKSWWIADSETGLAYGTPNPNEDVEASIQRVEKLLTTANVDLIRKNIVRHVEKYGRSPRFTGILPGQEDAPKFMKSGEGETDGTDLTDQGRKKLTKTAGESTLEESPQLLRRPYGNESEPARPHGRRDPVHSQEAARSLAQAIVRASDSSLLQNAAKDPELSLQEVTPTTSERELFAALEAATGAKVRVVRVNPQFERDTVSFHGVQYKGEIWLNENSNEYLESIIAHEWTHDLQKKFPALYAQYRDFVRANLTEAGRARLARIMELDPSLDENAALDEMIADFTSDSIRDVGFWSKLAKSLPQVARKLLDHLMRVFDGMTNYADRLRTKPDWFADIPAQKRELARLFSLVLQHNATEEAIGEAAPVFMKKEPGIAYHSFESLNSKDVTGEGKSRTGGTGRTGIPFRTSADKKPKYPWSGRPIDEITRSIPESNEARRGDFISETEKLESHVRHLRGKLTHMPEEQIAERLRIENEILTYNAEKREALIAMIGRYAREIRLGREANNRIASFMISTKTAAGFKWALKMMDDIVQKRQNRTLVIKVKEIVERTQKDLTAIAAQRKKSFRPVEHNDALKAYLDHLLIDPAQIAAAMEAAEAAVEREATENDSGIMSDEALNAVGLVAHRSIEHMSNSELAHVLLDIQSIKRTGWTAWQARQEKQKQEIDNSARMAAQEIKAVSRTIMPVTRAHAPIKAKSGWDRILTTLKDIEKSNLDPKRVIQWVTGTFTEAGRRGRSILEEEIHERVRTAFLAELDSHKALVTRIRSIFEPIVKDKDLLARKFIVKAPFFSYTTDFTDEESMLWQDLNGIEESRRSEQQQKDWTRLDEKRTLGAIVETELPLTLEQLMFVYANSRNEGNRAHLRGTGWTDDAIDIAEKMLPDPARQAVDKLIEFYDNDQYGRLNQVFRRVFDIDMPKVDGYFPIANIFSTKAETSIAADLISRYSARAGVGRGFTKVRVKSLAPYREMAFFRTVFDNLQKTEHFIAMSETIRYVNRYIHQRDLTSAILTRDPHFDTMGYLDDFIKRMAYGKIQNTQGWFDRVTDAVRFNYTTYVLGFSIRSMAKTFANLPVASKYVSPARLARSAADMFAHGMDLYEMAREKSIYMRHRSETYDREIHEMREKFADKEMFGKAMGTNDKLRSWSMAGLTTLDKINTTIVWTAKYREVLNATADEAQAIRFADEAVENSTPGGGLLYYTRAQMTPGMMRGFTMFMSDLAKIYNAFYETVKTTHNMKDVPELLWETALLSIIPALWVYAVDHGFDYRRLWDDPEGIIGAALSQLYGGLAVLNQVGDVTYTNLVANPLRKLRGAPEQKFGSGSTISIPWASTITQIGRPIADIKKGDWAAAALHTTDFFGVLTGVPIKQPLNYAKGIADLATGKTTDPRRAIWSPYALQDVSVADNTARQLNSSNKTTRLEAIKRWGKMSDSEKDAVREARRRQEREKARK